MYSRRSTTALLALAFSAIVPLIALHAQPCLGTPTHGGIAYERGAASYSSSNGVTAAYAGHRASVGGAYRIRDRGAITSNEGDFRFAVHVNVSRLMLCPNVGLGYAGESWKPEPAVTFDTKRLIGRAGVGLGIEQPVYKGFTVIPFVSARYEFHVMYIDLTAPTGSTAESSGDTLSVVDIEYGLMARFKFLYGGITAQRKSDSPGRRPYQSRLMLGVTWGGSGKSNSASSSRPPRP